MTSPTISVNSPVLLGLWGAWTTADSHATLVGSTQRVAKDVNINANHLQTVNEFFIHCIPFTDLDVTK